MIGRLRASLVLALLVSLVCQAGALGQDDDLRRRVEELEETVQSQQEKLENLVTTQGWLTSYWKEGLRFASPDKSFELKVGGRIQIDFSFFSQNRALETQIGNQQDSVEFRRARLYVAGTIYNCVEYKAEYDFDGGEADFKDVYIGLKQVPWIGSVRVGHQKEAFSLEELTSSKYITFLERSLPNALVPSRNTGIQLSNVVLDDMITYTVGAFRDTDDFGDGGSDGDYSLVGRVTASPLYENDGSIVAHVGAAVRRGNPTDDMVDFASGPEAHDADDFVDTGDFLADNVDLYGLEGALVLGPVSLQGEYIIADVSLDSSFAGPSPVFHGHYLYASWFVTGEHRVYQRSQGVFSRVKPKKNFCSGEDAGVGAVELTFRYSFLDLDDGSIDGGEITDFTTGANWYLNPNTRIMVNWINTDLEGSGEADILTFRFQVDF